MNRIRISKISIFEKKHFSFFSSAKKQAKINRNNANENIRFTPLLSIIPINPFLYLYEIEKYLFAEIRLSYLLN